MANYQLNKTQFPRNIYENVIDIDFSQNQIPLPLEETININQFFDLYNNIFYDIPSEGEINSHAYLVQRSGEYIKSDNNSEEIQILLDEISSLQQENLSLNQQLLQLTTSGSQTL